MDYQGRAESGQHLFARLSSRPSLIGLDDFLFPEGPKAKDVIDISGDHSSGKTFLLTQFLVKCLLPKTHQDFEIGGLGAGAILIDTDHHLSIFKLVTLMESKLERFKTKCSSDNKRFNSKTIHEIVKEALNNLTILKCFDSTQMQITFHSLPKILTQNPLVSIILLDSISAYYWQDVMSGGIRKMDLYAKRILEALQKCVQEYQVVIGYTRPTYFQSQIKDPRNNLDSCVMKVHFSRTEISNQMYLFNVEVTLNESKRSQAYTIGVDGLKWT